VLEDAGGDGDADGDEDHAAEEFAPLAGLGADPVAQFQPDQGQGDADGADERQKMLSLRSRALGWNFAMVTAFIGVTVGVAVKATWWWPFLVILAVTGFAYLLGLSSYGVAEEGTANDADTGHQVRSPASS
jgi:hypothetical protein